MTRDEALTEAIVYLAEAIRALKNEEGIIYKQDVDYACMLASDAITLARHAGKP